MAAMADSEICKLRKALKLCFIYACLLILEQRVVTKIVIRIFPHGG